MPIRETRMMARALQQRWPIDDKLRAGIIGALVRVLGDPNASPREKTSAAKALMAAERQNQEDEHKLIDVRIHQRNTELDAIARDLGIDPRLIVDAQRASGSGDRGTQDIPAA